MKSRLLSALAILSVLILLPVGLASADTSNQQNRPSPTKQITVKGDEIETYNITDTSAGRLALIRAESLLKDVGFGEDDPGRQVYLVGDGTASTYLTVPTGVDIRSVMITEHKDGSLSLNADYELDRDIIDFIAVYGCSCRRYNLG